MPTRFRVFFKVIDPLEFKNGHEVELRLLENKYFSESRLFITREAVSKGVKKNKKKNILLLIFFSKMRSDKPKEASTNNRFEKVVTRKLYTAL